MDMSILGIIVAVVVIAVIVKMVRDHMSAKDAAKSVVADTKDKTVKVVADIKGDDKK